MDLYEALYTTRAMRRVRPDPVPTDVQARILDAAIRAPSGGNQQNWRFLLVDDPVVKARLGPFIETHHELRQLLRKASTTRSAKKSNEGFVQIVQILRAGVERELTVIAELRHAGMLLQGKVSAALIERQIFPDEIGLRKTCLHVAEFVDLPPMDIAELTVIVYARLRML